MWGRGECARRGETRRARAPSFVATMCAMKNATTKPIMVFRSMLDNASMIPLPIVRSRSFQESREGKCERPNGAAVRIFQESCFGQRNGHPFLLPGPLHSARFAVENSSL